MSAERRYAELASDNPRRQRLREQLISGYLPVAEHIARRFAGRGEPLEDLVQVATVGLINAVDWFDPHRGGDFLAFAVPRITGELRRHLRHCGWPTSLSLNETLDTFAADLDDNLALIEEREVLRPLLAELAARERTILALRFFRQLTQAQIAEQIGISQVHVSRVLSQTLASLQERMDHSN